MPNTFLAAILIMGASGVVAQVLLLRELLVTFYGNELIIGIILSNWVILEAAGAFFLGRSVEHIKKRLEAFVLIQLIFSVSFPISIYLTRTLKVIMGLTPGAGLGLGPIVLSSLLILLPTSLCHGALFTFACRIYSFRRCRTDEAPPGRESYPTEQAAGASYIGMVYVYETVGTIIGGVVFTYILIPYLHSFQIAFAILILNLSVSVLLLGPFWQKDSNSIRRILSCLSFILLIPCLLSFIFGWVGVLQEVSIQRQWMGRGVLHYQNSIYGNIVVTKREEQFTFYSNGLPLVTTPTPEITFVEEFAHFPLLSHPAPEEILIISGGAGGLINELLKHPVKGIDYLELDPLIIELIKRYPTPMTEAELSSPRVNIKNMDGRLFVRKTKKLYDVILIGLSEPNDLQTNRLFTEEFFRQAKMRLKENGIFAFTLPGSYTYISRDVIELNVSVLKALKNSFRYIRIIPGDFNLFLSSDSEDITDISPDLLMRRQKERGLSLKLIRLPYLAYRMDEARLDWFMESIKEAGVKANRDFRPLAVFYNLAYWNARFSPYFNHVFRKLMRIDLWHLFMYIFMPLIIFIYIAAGARPLAHIGIPFSIATSGFAGMIYELLIIFSFQILYGYVYQQIGLLVTAFMAGAAVGALIMAGMQDRLKDRLSTYIKLEISIILFSMLFPIIIFAFGLYMDRPAISAIFAPAFLALCIFSGVVVGLEFPLANRIYLGRRGTLSHAAASLYGADLFGGWVGGVAGGVILLPLLGLAETCLVLIMLKICSILFLLRSGPQRSE